MIPYTREAAEADLRNAIDRGDSGAAFAAADAIDRMPPPAPASLLGAALWYANQGLPVFPVQPLSKVPYPGTRGVKDATLDTDRIRKWWSSGPGFADSNIGLATGHRVDVIDFDGPDAHASWGKRFRTDDALIFACSCGRSWDAAWLPTDECTCGQLGQPLPELPDPELDVLGTVGTPRPGGLHVYVPATGRGNRAGMLPGVDYRGLGGYVLAPPSVLDDRDDQHPGRYQFLRPLRELP